MAATHTRTHTEKHVHHGRTLAAWVGTIVTSIAFVIGAIALVIGNWPLFWVAVVLIVLALIATVVLRKMGHGAV